jgi:hypothetical protein
MKRLPGWLVLWVGAGVLALWQPVALYLSVLAWLGLPHVLWEATWVSRAWLPSLPRTVWFGVAAALATQALTRSALAMDRIDAMTAANADLVSLALAVAAVLPLLRGASVGVWLARFLALIAIPALLVSTGTAGAIGVLVGLSIVHNFTPIGLVPSRWRFAGMRLQHLLLALFAAPLLLFVILALIEPPLPSGTLPAEADWVAALSPRLAAALLPALVWAQCLHYLSVLYLIPKAMGPSWSGLPLRPLALAVCGSLTVCWMTEPVMARRLYAIAAGMHAWLEWPLILVAIAGHGPVDLETTQAAHSELPGQRSQSIRHNTR